MRINESTLKPGKLCKCPVVPISRFPVPPRSIQDLLFSTTEGASQLVSISQIPRTEASSVCCPHLGLPFWGGGGGRGWRNPGISPGTSPNMSLFALSSWFNDLIRGREGTEGAVLFPIPKEPSDISCFPRHEKSRRQAVIFKVWANLGSEGEQRLPQLVRLKLLGELPGAKGQRGLQWASESRLLPLLPGGAPEYTASSPGSD